MLQGLKNISFKLYEWITGSIDDFKTKKVKQIHADSLIKLSDRLYFFSLITPFTPLLSDEKLTIGLYLFAGFVTFLAGYTLKRYAYSIYEKIELDDEKKSRFSGKNE